MEFKANEAIYLQIASYVSENIVLGKWAVDEKIPSVRDLAINLQVNPNTVMRTYEFLQSQEVITNKRGIGFFVNANAEERIKEFRKKRFFMQELPDFFKTIYLLDISLEEIGQRYQAYQSENHSS